MCNDCERRKLCTELCEEAEKYNGQDFVRRKDNTSRFPDMDEFVEDVSGVFERRNVKNDDYRETY